MGLAFARVCASPPVIAGVVHLSSAEKPRAEKPLVDPGFSPSDLEPQHRQRDRSQAGVSGLFGSDSLGTVSQAKPFSALGLSFPTCDMGGSGPVPFSSLIAGCGVRQLRQRSQAPSGNPVLKARAWLLSPEVRQGTQSSSSSAQCPGGQARRVWHTRWDSFDVVSKEARFQSDSSRFVQGSPCVAHRFL